MEILDFITYANKSLEANENGILTLKNRADIWAALAALSDDKTGYIRRVQLNCACVNHVLDRWYARFPGDDSVEQLLRLADQVVAGEVDQDTAIRQRDRSYVDIVETRKYGDDPSAMFVGLAAANTVIEALVKNNVDAIPSADDDEDLDPEAYDTSYMCASAAARGLNGRPADIEARRRFWAWYLNQAIPAVYALS